MPAQIFRQRQHALALSCRQGGIGDYLRLAEGQVDFEVIQFRLHHRLAASMPVNFGIIKGLKGGQVLRLAKMF